MRQHTASGVEGVVAERVDQTYRAAARAWRKAKARPRRSGGVLGTLAGADVLIVGRFGAHGRLRVAGRTTPVRGRPSAAAGCPHRAGW
ncbi:hypothetical protein ACL02T_32590 [Pseudonocardia sp. RS010]|uniref:hypothetical protein n=1 Tax=Pseudonocardia sp. RS010 TaxID=3385979 RepID=UPI0039A1E125